MDSFTSSAAGLSTSFRVRHAEESDPEDNSYISSDANSVKSINKPFKKPTKNNKNKDNKNKNDIYKDNKDKTNKFKNEKGNKPNFTFNIPNSYVVKNGLFSYKLLDINYSTP